MGGVRRFLNAFLNADLDEKVGMSVRVLIIDQHPNEGGGRALFAAFVDHLGSSVVAPRM